jgi:GTPase Era involved in 16S rRNA processing
MSNWQQTCEQQRTRLEKTEVLADKLLTLCSKAQAHLPPEILQAIRAERPRLERQLERLRANRFEVAVIGLEKAGKSALLNAWLGQEILPSAAERCTYTTTEIWSARSEEEQELCIEYFNRQEIDALLESKKAEMQNFKQGTRDYDDIENDIVETESYSAQIYEYARQGKTTRPFKDIDEISEDLQQAVFKNRAQARAIKRIQLKTTRLLSDRDIVFHDVPGFDSPVAMHKVQAEKKLSECDAIIYAKKMDNPNINSPEKNMLQVADVEDPHVKVADKVFVVLTKSDMARDPSEYNDWLNKHRKDWQGVPEQRVITVCAAAYLAYKGTGTVDTNKYGQQSIENLIKLNTDDGIDRLKQSVNAYIDQERAAVLCKRCDALVGEIKKQAAQVFTFLDPIYSQITDNDTTEDDLYGEDFGKWWGSEWAKIRQDFITWGVANIDGRVGTDDTGTEHTKLTELRMSYNDGVKTLFANLQEAKKENMELTYKEAIRLVPVPAHGNKAIRDKLYPEIQRILQTDLPNQLTGSLKAITDEIVNKAKQSLYEIDDVERILLDNPAIIEQQIRHGFKTLFLRFGRVAADAFIALPLHERPRLLKEYEAEILTLEAFYDGSDKKTGNLTDYLRAGLWVVKTASAIGIVPPIVGKGIKATEKLGSIADMINTPKNSGSNFDPFSKPTDLSSDEIYNEPKDFESVVKEIEGDLIALQDYLQNSVFRAAGFITYSKQELQQIRERFVELEEKERRWDSIVRREAKRQNPNIPFKIHNRIEDFRLRREIALEIKEAKEVANNVI